MVIAEYAVKKKPKYIKTKLKKVQLKHFNMTPKEKAIELVNKMAFEVCKTDAIQCALIAVDEILTWLKVHSYSNKNYDAFVFYNEVKQEIELL